MCIELYSKNHKSPAPLKMALGNEVDDVTGLLEKTSVEQINIVRLPDKGRKLNSAEDGRYLSPILC